MSFLRPFHCICAGASAPAPLPLILARPGDKVPIRKETIMNKLTTLSACMTPIRTPLCPGRRQRATETVVKERRQALRPVILRQSGAVVGGTGFFYIEGSHVPRAAIQTLADSVRANGGRLPLLHTERDLLILCGAITKPKAKENRDGLIRSALPIEKALLPQVFSLLSSS